MALIGQLTEAELSTMTARVRERMRGGSVSISVPADATLTEIAGSAVQFILDTAPKAPESIAREAAIRLGGWLLDNRPHLAQHVVRDPSGTEITIAYANHAATANGFRHSGASALIARYVVRRAGLVGGAAVVPAAVDADLAGSTVMRAGFSNVIPHGQSTWRWAGTLNGVALDTSWPQPSSFALWIPGALMQRVIAVVLLRSISGGTPGDPVNLEVFGPAEDYRFGNTDGQIRFTPVTFRGQFDVPNDVRAILDEPR